jgi:hypothetical protein
MKKTVAVQSCDCVHLKPHVSVTAPPDCIQRTAWLKNDRDTVSGKDLHRAAFTN